MKEILLRITAVRAEITLGKLAHHSLSHLSFSREITLPQHPRDPNVDRECTQPLVGEEHHTISNLRTDPRQLAEGGAEIGVGQSCQLIEIDLSGGNQAGRGQQVGRTIPEPARAQFFL